MGGCHIWAVRTGERDLKIPCAAQRIFMGEGQVPHLPGAAEAGNSEHVDAFVGLAEFG